jgi:hypothetical protein
MTDNKNARDNREVEQDNQPENTETTMSEATTQNTSDGEEQDYEAIDEWKPESIDVRLEIGISGVCNHCETQLVEDHTGDGPRLSCPDCGYIAGLVVRFPTLQEGGEAGESVPWPDSKTGWEIDDGRATFDIGIRGEHIDCGDFVNNVAESQFGVAPSACCEGCEQQFGHARQMNTLVDPINDINHLDS